MTDDGVYLLLEYDESVASATWGLDAGATLSR